MDASVWNIMTLLDNDEALSKEQFDRLLHEVRSGEAEQDRFAEQLEQSVSQKSANLARNAVLAMKAAQGYYALSKYEEAVKWLEKAGNSKQQCWLKAYSLRELNDYDSAISGFEEAESKGCDSFDVGMAIVETLRRKGELEEAQARLKKFSRMGDIRAEYHYQLGMLHDANGRREESMEEFERAISLDSNHARALFGLAYACDLYGDEEQAIEYYQRCLESGTIYVSALLNLAVLYEDAGNFDEAYDCIYQVLMTHPNHERARLYLKDVSSSLTMYYDEDQERRVDRRNQVLQIPISDFELSVRSRNCLRKMNIRYLADLLKVTEAELLAYKNFGETSLQEIKVILNSKGLRLGQLLEDHNNARAQAEEEIDEEQVDDELLSATVGELGLSVRARKCLQRLNLNTIGELTQRTEAELLGCKNFGITSLDEIKKSLTDKGLTLRQLDD
jgi:DNA-directed RNA polymerase subunit alpha